MDNRFSGLIVTAAIAAAASAAISVSVTRTSRSGSGCFRRGRESPPLKTAWGEPDLQGFGQTNLRRPYSALPICEPGIFHRGATR